MTDTVALRRAGTQSVSVKGMGRNDEGAETPE